MLADSSKKDSSFYVSHIRNIMRITVMKNESSELIKSYSLVSS